MKLFRVLVIAVTLTASIASVAWASGGQNQGSKGQGNVIQNQNRK